MDVEKQSEEEFEIFLENKRKKAVKNKIIGGISLVAATIGIYAFSGYALCKNAEGVVETAIENSIQRPPSETIEKLVLDATTPKEAFDRISEDIAFSRHFDTNRLSRDYWSSLQETYGLRAGDCEDGAIAFKAMLSDNPEYEINLVHLNLDNNTLEKQDHMVAAYKDANTQLWGIASFNTIENEKIVNKLLIPIHGTIKATVEAYAKGRFDSWHIVEISNENLMFGRNLEDDVESISEEYIL